VLAQRGAVVHIKALNVPGPNLVDALFELGEGLAEVLIFGGCVRVLVKFSHQMIMALMMAL
jgi:hypothetical protein